ncbi:hypothetical protein [Gaetbulibacter aestuarii]|uniref:Lipocalin-like domain-containing protein n=1 Tax=Gaetbulibacter aestuarii TaxID=1502358 RepID=A0ABW7MW40_9FLAO
MLFLLLLISCQPNQSGKGYYSGLGDYSGIYQFLSKTPETYDCEGLAKSLNDLEISSDGQFIRKMHGYNANNECVIIETLTGKITITHPNKWTPHGIAEYDNSDLVELIILDWMEDGKHNEISFDRDDGSAISYTYSRVK